jgi:serine phosphatase RsbU (regulator of sigma subunit)
MARSFPINNGLPLGIAPNVAYAESSIHLAPNDRLTFLSDGVVEAQNERGELFGFDRTAAISTQSAEETVPLPWNAESHRIDSLLL